MSDVAAGWIIWKTDYVIFSVISCAQYRAPHSGGIQKIYVVYVPKHPIIYSMNEHDEPKFIILGVFILSSLLKYKCVYMVTSKTLYLKLL